MAIAADEGAIKTHLAHVKGRDGSQLRGEEVLLGNVIHIVENAKHRQLHPVLALVGIGGGADEDVQALAGDALGHGLLHLVGSQVGQQVGNDELGFLRLPADADVDHIAVFQGHNAVQLQRNGDPLVLLDAAIVVGAEKAHLIGLIHGDLLQIQPGRIHMGAGDHRALAQVLAADDGQHQSLPPVVAVELHARAQLHARHILYKAPLLRHGNGVVHRLPLRAGVVQKRHIAQAVVLQGFALLGADQVIAVLLLIKQAGSHIIHGSISP